MLYLKFISQNDSTPGSSNLFFESHFRYVVADTLEKVQGSSHLPLKSLRVKIPQRFDASWRARYKDYILENAFFGIALDFLTQQISKREQLLDNHEYVVNEKDSFDFNSKDFSGFNSRIIQIELAG